MAAGIFRFCLGTVGIFFFLHDPDEKKKKTKSFGGVATAVVLKCFGFILRLVFSEYLFLHLETHAICMVSLGDVICIGLSARLC